MTTLQLDTKAYGRITVTEKQKIYFKEGLYGFEHINTYYLLDIDEGPFYWLQSEGHKEIAFVILDPYSFKPDYELKIKESDYASIGIKLNENKEDLLHFVIVTIPEDPQNITANLLGPIIINKNKRLGRQALSLREDYSTKHYILEELKQ